MYRLPDDQKGSSSMHEYGLAMDDHPVSIETNVQDDKTSS